MASITLPAVVGGSVAAISTGYPALTLPILLCSIAGAALFTLITHEPKVYKQCIYFFVSFVTGVSGYELSAAMLSKAINFTVPNSVGALIASTIAVTVLTKLVELAQSWKRDE